MDGDFEKLLGQKIRIARQRAGLTQEELAGRIARTSESISNIERGQQEPSIKTIQSLARELNVPMAEFFDDVADNNTTANRQRLEMEFRLRDLARGLTDRDLAVAVAQIQVLLATK
jgi:transcriptional regulator with XRE-family HTH domain